MQIERYGFSRVLLTGILSAAAAHCGANDPGGSEFTAAPVVSALQSDDQPVKTESRCHHRRPRLHGSDDGHGTRLDHLYVGCRDATGTIQHYRISSATGAVSLVDAAFANAAVSNTAMDECEDFLYVAHTDTGRISTFTRDQRSGTLTLDSAVPVPGSPDPASNPATQTLEIDHTGRFLLAANYTANTALVYALEPDGRVGDLVETREDGLNAHQTLLNARNQFALVPYLGSNTIAVYRFDQRTGALAPHAPFLTTLPTPTSGPRHVAFHPNASWFYVISESAGVVDLFNFDNRRGTLAHEQTVSSLPADFNGAARSGSEIEIDAAGKFLYVSNRLDQVANGILGVYAIDRRAGTLTPIQFEGSRGVTPRQFSLSPAGDLLVVGNQGSNNMSVFKVNQTTGLLTYVATTPVCAVPFFARMVAP
jgi:6-phosphogluconolactonase